MRNINVERRLTKRTSAIIRKHSGEADVRSGLVYLLQECGTILGVSRITGLNRTTIYSAIAALEIEVEPHDHSAYMIEHMASLSEQERIERTAAAHNATKGRTVSSDEKTKRARTVQKTRMPTASEKAVGDALRNVGMEPIHEFAAGIYNIDVAIPDIMLAIEVNVGSWHHTENKKIQDIAKRDALEKMGWTVIVLYGARYAQVKSRAEHFALGLSIGLNRQDEHP